MIEKLKVYSYNRCSTCRKALKWLNNNNVSYDLFDIVNENPDKGILKLALGKIDNRKIMLNTSGISYRSIGASVIAAMDDNEFLDTLAKDGKLIKRPFLITCDQKVLFGFKPDTWEKVLIS